MKSRVTQSLTLLVVLGALVALRVYGSAPPPELEALVLKERVVQPIILASGQLAFARESALSSELVGRVTRIAVREGELVHAGQTLLQLDANTFSAQLEQHQAQVREARIRVDRAGLAVRNLEREFERKRQLAAGQFIGPSALDDAQHLLDTARVDLLASQESLRQSQAALTVARESLGKTEIRSPISGTVVAVPIRVGETAIPSANGIPGSALMTVADTSAMHAEVLVDEAEVATVGAGQRARVYPAGRDDAPLLGRVVSVSMAPKAGSRNYLVRVALDAPGPDLRTGMSCRVELAGKGRSPMLAVPVQALQTEGRGSDPASKGGEVQTQVWVFSDGRAQKRRVTLGASDDRFQEVRSGLKAGDQILVGPIRALRELSEGQTVRSRAWREAEAS